jgi:serine-type D-Ala-D-Ala carboxypeptidase (penicillin-binding protein 5/6)
MSPAGEGLESRAGAASLSRLKTMRPIAYLTMLAATLMLALPARAAESYIIVDDETGHILDSSNSNEKRQVASLTKIATAMVVYDWATATGSSLAAEAEVPADIANVGGENPCGLQPGDRVALRDLAYAALMQSDNHAAYTLAHNVGAQLPNKYGLSPVDNFTAHMNALARKLKMKRTLFLNPHGIDNLESPPYSSSADLARLTRYAGDNAAFNFAVAQGTREIAITGPDGMRRGFLLQNTNQLLGQEGIDGVKTGRTSRAGDCVILSSDREPQAVEVNGQKVAVPRRISVVVLGSQDRFGEGLALIRRGWDLHDKWTSQGRPVSKRSSL